MIRKHTISEASYKMLFDYLASVFEMPYMDFQPHLCQKLQNKIISGLSGKVRQREELLRMEARDKVRAFHKLYPQVKGKKRKVRLLDKDAASYLDMTEFTFSRLVKEMIGRGEEIRFVYL